VIGLAALVAVAVAAATLALVASLGRAKRRAPPREPAQRRPDDAAALERAVYHGLYGERSGCVTAVGSAGRSPAPARPGADVASDAARATAGARPRGTRDEHGRHRTPQSARRDAQSVRVRR
jgi:hypothetical protein